MKIHLFTAFIMLLMVMLNPALSQTAAEPPALTPQEQEEIRALELRARNGAANAALQLADKLQEMQRHAEAARWYHHAFVQDSGRAGFALYQMYRQGVAKLAHPEEIRVLSVNMMEHAAENGDASSALILGIAYLKGDYVVRNYAKSLTLLEKARSQGKAMASYHLGNIYSNGLFMPMQPRRAFAYYAEASDQGVSEATRQLGLSYISGTYHAKDPQRAKQLLEKSIQQGSVEAMRDLGNFYRYEENNMTQYAYWMQKAADAGNRDALFYVGLQLEKQNKAKADEYFTAAALQGHLMAKQKVPDVEQLSEDEVQ